MKDMIKLKISAGFMRIAMWVTRGNETSPTLRAVKGYLGMMCIVVSYPLWPQNIKDNVGEWYANNVYAFTNSNPATDVLNRVFKDYI